MWGFGFLSPALLRGLLLPLFVAEGRLVGLRYQLMAHLMGASSGTTLAREEDPGGEEARALVDGGGWGCLSVAWRLIVPWQYPFNLDPLGQWWDERLEHGRSSNH